MEELPAAGAGIDVCDGEEWGTPLLVAVYKQEHAAAMLLLLLLLQRGADPNVPGREGVTPPHFAATWLTEEPVVEALLDA
jgi:hypothetical protein